MFDSSVDFQYEDNEDHLRDSLSTANREREELIERLSWYQNKVKGQQEEVRLVYVWQTSDFMYSVKRYIYQTQNTE